MTPASIPPIERTVTVSWDTEAAFRRFTLEFAEWWPWRTHSIGGKRVKRIVFEPRAAGLIYEEHSDGRRFQWGKVLEWDPPRRVKFTWHPSRDESTAQDVEVKFLPEGAGTRLVLTATNWEKWGPRARVARNGYDVGWGYVLNVWAGRRTAGMLLMDGIASVVGLVDKLRGGAEGAISRAGGEISRSAGNS
ncbi:MAG TPA: SRPBCC domain-containing protein [Candidatus Polarisedimenticolia bacterium]|nr:SRPBCC domain-containing protein [Candidatus Polarisedimenticolia bacterium]